MDKKEIGTFGEKVAEEYLINCGYKIVEKNFRCRFGEIDIIAVKHRRLIFCEVKIRLGDRYGRPCEAVGKNKMLHIKKAALYYMTTNDFGENSPEFDVIEICLNHIENAF